MVSVKPTERWITRSVATLVLCMLAAAPAAARQIMVGTGTADSCSEAALQLALLTAAEERGGVIRFDCGDAPATISIARLLPGEARPARLVLPDHTTIDGDGLITFDGTAKDGILILVPPGASAELRDVTVRGGALSFLTVFNLGTLEVDRCTFSQNLRGGIYNRGDLRVRDSLFTRNGGIDSDGAIFNFGGTLTVDHTTFVSNFSDGGGGGIRNHGSAIVRNSIFTLDRTHWRGGAFLNDANADAIIQNSEFSDNIGENHGGALSNAGTLTLRNSSVHDNGALFSLGGGIYLAPTSVTLLSNSTVTGNRAALGGGIYIAPGASPPTLIHTIVSDNFPDDIAPQ